MEKIAQQSVPGLWTTQWWDIGQQYVVLVRVHSDYNTLQILTKSVGQNNPPHWDQSIDVTKSIVSGMLLDSDAQLITDAIQCSYIKCNNIEPILLCLEQYVATLQ